MEKIIIFMQVVVALGIFNVWLVRYGKETNWRGGTAKNMKQEFAAYGLSTWFMVTIGTVKVILATLLLIGIWVPMLVKPAAIILAILMIGAVAMHIKISDPLKKSLPALAMLALSTIVAALSL